MSIPKKIKALIVNKEKRIFLLARLGLLNHLSDVEFVKKQYLNVFDKELNLDNPITFNEKLQWLKVNDHRPEYSLMVDKFAVKDFVAKKIGRKYIIKTIGVWNSFEEIDFSVLPDRFVLKCTHDSGGVVVCSDKEHFDAKKAKRKLNRSLRTDYFMLNREWPYKNVPRRIIAEEYLSSETAEDLVDYKFFCFGGKVKCFKCDIDRSRNHQTYYFDKNQKYMGFGELNYPPRDRVPFELPKTISQMMDLAEVLSEGIPFCRVDFYDVDGKIFFGEITFFPASGFGKFTDEKWDNKMGSWIQLPKDDEL